MTERIPKALVEINGEPFLAHQLRLLRAHGIERVVLCIGQLGEQIREFAGDGARFGLAIEYSLRWAALLGTAGAIRRALPLLGDAFFVLYGDSYLPCAYRDVEQAVPRSRQARPDDGLSQRRPLGHQQCGVRRMAAFWPTIRRTGRRACNTSITAWASFNARRI